MKRLVRKLLHAWWRDSMAGTPSRMFVAGYLVALDDIERTGLRPFRDREQRQCAERALHRYLGELDG